MTSPQAEATATTLLLAYQAQAQQLRAQIESFIRQLWQSLGLYREPQMRDFVGQVTPMVLGGQQRMSSLTAAYLAAQRQARFGSGPVVTVDPRNVTGEAVRAAPPAEVYSRPFHLVWRDLAAAQEQKDAHYTWTAPTTDVPARPGLPPSDYVDKAIQAGADRAVNLAQTDLQLTKTATARQVIQHDERATGYRRVLEGAHSCGLCIVAATALYHKKKLMPIHPGCDCSVEPDYGEFEPGQALARQGDELVPVGDIRAAHAAVRERFGKSSSAAKVINGQFKDNGQPLMYRDALIEHSNSEIGPVLAVRGQKFSNI